MFLPIAPAPARGRFLCAPVRRAAARLVSRRREDSPRRGLTGRGSPATLHVAMLDNAEAGGILCPQSERRPFRGVSRFWTVSLGPKE